MDYIREFDIRLEKEMYYAGETVYGVVILDTSENFKLRGIRLHIISYDYNIEQKRAMQFLGLFY